MLRFLDKERINNTDIAFVSQIVQEVIMIAAIDTKRPIANLPLYWRLHLPVGQPLDMPI